MKISPNSFVAASMRLFKSVLEAKEPSSKSIVLEEYGLVIDQSASHFEKEILAFLKANQVSDKQKNQTFYSSANEVESKSFEERLVDQLTHYLSTYGLRSLGIETDFMYVPHNWEQLNLPKRVKFDVVTGVSQEVLIKACFDLLSSGIAMKQETIEDVLTVLDYLCYKYTGSELIANREARMFIYDRKNITPTNSEDLFRFIVFKATGKSSLVKDKKTLELIKASAYRLPNLSDAQLRGLAKSFNRRKAYWMAIKLANPSFNAPVVNKISRYSKSLHAPLEQDILNNLTSLVGKGELNLQKLKASLGSVPIFRVVRAINALQIQSADRSYSMYSVRNGKVFVKPFAQAKATPSTLAEEAYSMLLEHVAQHIDRSKKVYIPEGLQYALPTSEKQFVGEVPNFSTIDVDYSQRDLLVGVYWENGDKSYVDYDLSCGSLGGARVGWNDRWANGDLVFSGDVTNAVSGAAEWMVVKNLSSSWQIVNNLYGHGYSKVDSYPDFTIMVGYGNKGGKGNYRNYFIDPDDVLFSAKVSAVSRQTVIGVVSPVPGEPTKARFTLLNSGNGGRAVATSSGAVSLINALLPRAENTLKINSFLNLCSDPAEADVDLSPAKLTKTSLLELLK